MNRRVQGPVEWTSHGVHRVHSLDGLPFVFRRHQTQGNLNSLDDQYPIFLLNLPSNFSSQLSIACINVTRFQRARKGAHHSTGSCRNHVVDSGGMRLLYVVG